MKSKLLSDPWFDQIDTNNGHSDTNVSRIYAISCQETTNPLISTLLLDYWSEVMYTTPGLLIRSPVHYPWTIDQKSCTLPLEYWSEVLYTTPGLLIRSPVHYPWTIDQKSCTLPLDYWSEVLYTTPGLLIRSPVHYPWTIDQKSCTLPLDYWSEVLYTTPGLLRLHHMLSQEHTNLYIWFKTNFIKTIQMTYTALIQLSRTYAL